MTSKERCLAALRGQPVDHTPIFPLLMFFAADRAGLTYRQYATDGHALAEAQLRARARYGIDALTACSDAFRLSADLGAEMAFPEAKPPHAVRPLLSDPADLSALHRLDPLAKGSRMADRVLAVEELARAAGEECLVLGWVEMPFAEACNLVGLSDFLMLLVTEPAQAHAILERVTDLEIDFARAQLAAGAAMIGAGDAAASLISPEMYREFALPYARRVAEAVHAAGGLAKLHICGNTSALLADMATSGCDLYNVDSMVDLHRAREVYGAAGLCYKGNLDPVSDMLQATPDFCRAKARECLRLAEGTRFMLSAGCEIPAGVTDAVMEAFCGAWR